jgi:hypothetical protein
MRALRWLPLAFLAGTHGFVLFAPYAAVIMAVLHVVHARRKAAAARQPLPQLVEL